MPQTGQPTPSRRAVLAATAAGSLALAGCRGIAALGPPPKPGPAVTTLRAAITAEERIIAQYEAALTVFSGREKATGPLKSILAEHHSHLARLRSVLVVPPGLPTSPSPSQSPSAPPAGRREALAGLITAERSAAARLTQQLLHMPSATAQLMASISASEAAHVIVLDTAGTA